MKIYYNTGYEKYIITEIEYEYDTYGGYLITYVILEFDNRKGRIRFPGLLSLPDIIRELSHTNVLNIIEGE